MTTFDFEPEDSYDAGDPPLTRARNIARRLRLIDGLPDPAGDDLGELVAGLELRLVDAARRPELDTRARRRLELAALHLFVVIGDA
jgi:hypothetical protein